MDLFAGVGVAFAESSTAIHGPKVAPILLDEQVGWGVAVGLDVRFDSP